MAIVVLVVGSFLTSPAAGRESSRDPSGTTCRSTGPTRGLAAYKQALRTYDDPIEDSRNAPDFCASELVTNDTGTITIGIHAHNRNGIESGDTYGVLLDTDLNPSTGGGPTGAEYEITLDSTGARVNHWNGVAFDPASATTVHMKWVTGYGPMLVLQRTAIGSPTGFTFVMVSSNGQDGDRAPDEGSWSYTLRPFTLQMRSLSLGPARAGRPLTARAVVVRSDLGTPLSVGEITCAGKLSGRAIRGKGRFARGTVSSPGPRVTCAWRLPKSAAGKLLSGTVAVTFEGVEARRSFSVRVK